MARFQEIHAKLNEVEKNIIKEIYDMKLLALAERSQKTEISNQN